MISPTDTLNASHATAMDRMYRWQRHFYDMTRRYYLLGRNEMLQRLNAQDDQSILEIGCGTGRNLKIAQKLYPRCELYGLDISEEMLKSARANLAKSAHLAQGDATNFDAQAILGLQKFDRIYFSYTLSMVPQWKQALSHSLNLLGQNGQLHIVDFGQSENLPTVIRRIVFRWLKFFDVTPRADLNSTLLELIDEQKHKLHFKPSRTGYAWHVVIK
jgi:S-adenosylmethionine-diacylgycerolhomoserine-N-methlytransferase